MPIDLSALGQIGSAAAGTVPLAQQRWAAAQQAQQEAEQQRRELAAQQIFGSLGPDMPDLTQLPGGQQAPAPGQSSQPMQQPTSMNQVFAPSAAQSSPGATAVAPSSPPGAFPGAGPSATPVGTGTTGQPTQVGQAGLGALEQYLRQRNPQADPATIGLAAQRIWTMMSPLQQQRLMMQEQAAQARLYAQLYGINTRADTAHDVANIGAGSRLAAANIGAGSRETVANIGAGSRETVAQEHIAATDARTRMVQDRIDARAAARSDPQAKQVAAEYKVLAATRAQIKDQINAYRMNNQTPPANLETQLNDVNSRIVQNWSRNKWLPQPGEIAQAQDTPAAPAAAAGPAGAPDPSTLPEGRTGTDDAGQRWVTKGGAWVKQ